MESGNNGPRPGYFFAAAPAVTLLRAAENLPMPQ